MEIANVVVLVALAIKRRGRRRYMRPHRGNQLLIYSTYTQRVRYKSNAGSRLHIMGGCSMHVVQHESEDRGTGQGTRGPDNVHASVSSRRRRTVLYSKHERKIEVGV
jgi:hypothetical protein